MNKILPILCAIALFLSACTLPQSIQKYIYKDEQSAGIKNDTYEKDEEKIEEKISSPQDFFNKITNQIRRDWEPDAKIYKIQATIQNSDVKNFINFDYKRMWEISYTSPTRRKMITVSVPVVNNKAPDTSKIQYTYKNTHSEYTGKTTIGSIRKNVETKIDEVDIADRYSSFPTLNEWFTEEWKTDFNSIGQKIYERVKNEAKYKGASFETSLFYCEKWNSLNPNAPIWEIKWETRSGRLDYFVINAKTGEVLFDSSGEAKIAN